jgi:hypothetical protein
MPSMEFELSVPKTKPLQTYALAARPAESAYLSLKTFFGVHLTSARLSRTKLLLVYELSSEHNSECFRKHVWWKMCVNIVRNAEGYGKGC